MDLQTQTTTSPPSRPRMTQRERSARARKMLLDSAIELVYEQGFAALRMSDVAARAGMTRGAIQHHFEGRDDLMLAVLQEVEERIVEGFSESHIRSDMTIEQRLDILIDQFAEQGLSPAYLAVLDIWMTTRAEPGLKDPVREAMLRASKKFRELWIHAFEDQVPQTIIAECRRVVVTVMRGAVFSRLFMTEPRSYNLTIATLKTMVQTHMLNGIKPGATKA